MRALKVAAAVVIALSLTTGCGEPTEENNNNGGADAGSTGGADGGNNNNNNNGGSLTINAATGLDLVDNPAENEGSVSGTILIDFDDDAISDATVELNGVAVPYDDALGVYNVSKATLPAIAPGATMTIKATRGSDSTTLTFTCPTEVTLTAPAASTAVSAGETVTVSWTGKIDYGNVGVALPRASIRSYDTATKRLGFTRPGSSVNATGTSVTLDVPDLSGDEDAWVAELRVPGEFTTQGDNDGYCALVRRNQLTQMP